MSLHKSVPLKRLVASLGLFAALGAVAPAAMATLAYSGVGSYNLGTDSSAGATASPSTTCGTVGQDSLIFTGSGVNNIGIHSYSCDGSIFGFGSRSSGENTFYADGKASITGTFSGNFFDFFISSGQIGAWGSTSFGAGEYEESSLIIKLIIDGTTYIDDEWLTHVDTGGAVTASHTSTGSHSVASDALVSGAGYASYGIFGGFDSIFLADDGTHTLDYTISSLARGNITSTSSCLGVTFPRGGGIEEAAATVQVAAVAEGNPGNPFNAYCGSGGQSGDPFQFDPDIVRPLPLPGSLALAGASLLALGALRRRKTN